MIAERYMLVSSLGEGGMADVYLAIDTILNREVAIKILRGELGNDPIALLRFQREANAASKLNHPNVVDVYDVGEYKNKHYIVMEYIRGRTLKQLLSQRGALHKEEAVDIMIQLTSAVQHAHENHIIHRDIKPQNILVKDDGTVKITDFGIALAHDAIQLTQSDAVLGSAHYLAPETTRGETATNQIDIYALGIVFYELLSGSVPFNGENPVQIAMKHLREEMPSIREFNPTLPQSIENIILKATVKNKNLRYASAQDMFDDLKLCLLPKYANVKKIVFQEENQEVTKIMERDRGNTKTIEKEEEDSSSKTNKVLWGLLITLLVMICAGLLFIVLYFTGVVDDSLWNPYITLPDIATITKDELTNQLVTLGVKKDNIVIKEELSKNIPAGEVIAMSPTQQAKKNETIEITVSKGLYFEVANYVGKDIKEVEKQIRDSKANIQIVKEEKQSKDTRAGIILEQKGLGEGELVDPDEKKTITLVIASSPQFTIENVIGKNVDEAEAYLKDLGAAVIKSKLSKDGLSEEELSEIKEGVVVDCNPKEGTFYKQEGESVIKLFYY